MPTLNTDDGVKLYYEEAGSGAPIVFVHEFAGDFRSWEPQVRHFSRRYRCIAFNARGYPPSEVPGSVENYSQNRARDDIRSVLDALGIQRAHVVGNSMGGFATLHFGIAYSPRAI
jgi:pimeloyl-ACP methyl ester carboxylesterase